MIKTWRWFGPKDPITLKMLKQMNVEGVVSALHHLPNGSVWALEEIYAYKKYIEDAGLKWSVVESLPVIESIKYGGGDRDQWIENYKQSLINLGKAGIRTICYNFMPVIDWVRTDLNHPLPNGTATLFFDKIKLAYFDCLILKRKDASLSYSEEEMKQVEELDKIMIESEKQALIDTIIVKTQGFINGNIDAKDLNPIALFKDLLLNYQYLDKEGLRNNLKYFLQQIIPTCEEYGLKMCIHPDDPPFSVFGLPRIVSCREDIEWILGCVDKPCNGLAFCAGSLSSGIHNEVIELAKTFVSRTHFVHLRSTSIRENGTFIEASHLEGRGNLIDLVQIFEKEDRELAMRIDHGALMFDDEKQNYNPGYSLHGRMWALAQVDGIMATVNRYNNQDNNKQ